MCVPLSHEHKISVIHSDVPLINTSISISWWWRYRCTDYESNHDASRRSVSVCADKASCDNVHIGMYVRLTPIWRSAVVLERNKSPIPRPALCSMPTIHFYQAASPPSSGPRARENLCSWRSWLVDCPRSHAPERWARSKTVRVERTLPRRAEQLPKHEHESLNRRTFQCRIKN